MKKVGIILQPFIQLTRFERKQKAIGRLAIFWALVKLALYKRFAFSGTAVSIKMGRLKLLSPDSDTLSLLVKEKFVEEQYFFEEGNTRPIIFDCGSSIG